MCIDILIISCIELFALICFDNSFFAGIYTYLLVLDIRRNISENICRDSYNKTIQQ